MIQNLNVAGSPHTADNGTTPHLYRRVGEVADSRGQLFCRNVVKTITRLLLLIVLTRIAGSATTGQLSGGPAITTQEGFARTLGSLEGVVVNVHSGDPVPEAAVVAVSAASSPGPRLQYKAVSNTNGGFAINNIIAGSYDLTTVRAGFVRPDMPASPLSGIRATYVTISPGERISGIRLGVVPTSAVAGRISDTDGVPLSSVQVRLLQREYDHDGQAGLYSVAGTSGGLTNEKGEYRLFNVPPGEYFLWVNPSQPSLMPTYFPGVTSLEQASPVLVDPGAELAALDVSVPTGRLYSIRVTVIDGMDGNQQPRFELRPRGAIRQESVLTNNSISRIEMQTYSLLGIAPGAYSLYVFLNSMPPSVERLDIDITDHDVDLGALSVRSPVSVRGRLMTAEGNPLPGYAIVLSAIPVGNGLLASAPERTNLDGGFVINPISDGVYRVQVVGLRSDRYISGLRQDNRDVFGTGLVVDGRDIAVDVMTDGPPGTVAGRVLNAKDEPVISARVVMIPEPRLRKNPDLFLSAVSDQSGGFAISGIPAGDYSLAAWENTPGDAFKNEAFLQRYDLSQNTLHVTRGSNQTVAVRAIPRSK